MIWGRFLKIILPAAFAAAVLLSDARVSVGTPVLLGGKLRSAVQIGAQERPLERRLGGFTKSLIKSVRYWARHTTWMLSRGLTWWSKWFRRLGFFVGVVVVVLLADRGLISAWRREGLHVLLNYVPLMMYVYVRLLAGSGVSRWAKALLLVSIAYGVLGGDLVPDRALIPGRVDDIIIITIATRLFVFSCPEELTNAYAQRAINLRQRVVSRRSFRRR